MATPYGYGFDPLAQQSRLAERLTLPDPLADYRARVEKAMIVDHFAPQRRVAEALAATDRLAEIDRILKPPVVDLLAAERRAFDAMVAKPREAYENVMRSLRPQVDPFALERRLLEQAREPLVHYERILADFHRLTGGRGVAAAGSAEPAFEGPAAAEDAGTGLGVPSGAMALHLVAIAWVCFWLIRDGVNVELLGGLMIDAFALAEVYWSDSQE